MMRWLVLAVAACGSSASDKPETVVEHEPPARPRPPPKPGVPGIALPVVAATGYAPADASAKPRAVVSPSAVIVEGAPVLALRGGVVGTEEMRALAKWLEEFSKKTYPTGPKPPLVLAVDRGVTYRALTRLMVAAASPRAGTWTQVSLLALADDKLVAVPVELHDDAPRGRSGGPASVKIAIKDGVVTADPLMPDTVLARIRSDYLAGIDGCYGEALAATPGLRGRFDIRFTVGPSGTVTAGAAGPHGMGTCVDALMRTWKFPLPRSSGKPTSVDFAFGFFLAEDPGGRVRPLPDDATPLDMTLSVYKNQARLWSASGFEGTEHEPLATVFTGRAPDALAPALAAVVERHGHGVPRPADAQSIVIRADGDIAFADLAPLLGAVRATAKGDELFPRVRLAVPIE